MTAATLNGEKIVILTEREFNRLKNSSQEKTLTRKEVAELWRISPNRLSECPWLLPIREKGKHQVYLASEILELIAKRKERLKAEYGNYQNRNNV